MFKKNIMLHYSMESYNLLMVKTKIQFPTRKLQWPFTINKSYHLMSIYCVPGTVLIPLSTLVNLILKTANCFVKQQLSFSLLWDKETWRIEANFIFLPKAKKLYTLLIKFNSTSVYITCWGLLLTLCFN